MTVSWREGCTLVKQIAARVKDVVGEKRFCGADCRTGSWRWCGRWLSQKVRDDQVDKYDCKQ
jgi:hypothetical protein